MATGSCGKDRAWRGGKKMIAGDRANQDANVQFAMQMGLAARLWRTATDQLAKSAGYEGCSLIPLYHLAAHPSGLTQVELSRRMRISESTVARMLRPLAERGLISRTRMIGDGRARLVRLEPLGKEAIESFEPQAAALRSILLEGIGEEEIKRATSLLSALTQRLSDYCKSEISMD